MYQIGALRGRRQMPSLPKKAILSSAASSCSLPRAGAPALQLRVSHRGRAVRWEGMDGQVSFRLETFPGPTCHVSTSDEPGNKSGALVGRRDSSGSRMDFLD